MPALARWKRRRRYPAAGGTMVGEGAALASAFLWALSNILMGSQSGRVPTLVISTLHSLYGAVFLTAIAIAVALTGATTWPAGWQLLGMAGSSALGMGAGDTLYIASLHRVGVSRALPISMAVYPLLTIALAVSLLGEQVTLLMVAGTLLIILGVYLVATGGMPRRAPEPARHGVTGAGMSETSISTRGMAGVAVAALPQQGAGRWASDRDLWLGLGMVSAASVTWALSSVWLKPAAEGVEPVIAQAVRVPAALAVTALVAHRLGLTLWPARYGRGTAAPLLLTGVLGTGLGSLCFIVALQHAGAATTAVLSSTGPLFALPMAALWLGERVTRRIVLGTVLSIAGIVLVV